jgi:glycosyltransferase involved in cell wall biosynthesis
MTPPAPLVSLIIPAWNVGPYIGKALQSARDQTLRDIEIIVIENGSTDDTAAEIARHQADPRLVVLRSPVNAGAGAGRNLGLARARGAYVAFLDGDDWLEPAALATAVACARDNDAEVVLFGYTRWTPRRRKVKLPPRLGESAESDRCRAITGALAVCMRLLRRDLIDRLGLSFPDGAYEDMAWSIRTSIAARRIAAVRQPLYVYRKREGSTLMSRSDHHWDALRQWQAIAAAVAEINAAPAIRRAVTQAMVRQTRRIFAFHRLPAASEPAYFKAAGEIAARLCKGDWPSREARALALQQKTLYRALLFPSRAVNRLGHLARRGRPASATAPR